MSTPVFIPKLEIAMTEGTLVSWIVPDGSSVEVGDPLYNLETDKVENEINSPAAGIVRHLAEAGETYPVGHQIGSID